MWLLGRGLLGRKGPAEARRQRSRRSALGKGVASKDRIATAEADEHHAHEPAIWVPGATDQAQVSRSLSAESAGKDDDE